MERELMVMRHGKSNWKPLLPDLDRPLKKRGTRHSRRMGAWMRGEGLCPERILTSPARRAWDTALLVAEACGIGEEAIQVEPVIYGGAERELLLLLRQIPDSVNRLLLIGHNPDLDDLVVVLSRGGALHYDDGKLMVTAAVARFRVPTPWIRLGTGQDELIEIVRPRWIKEVYP